MVLVMSGDCIGCDWRSGAIFCGTCASMSGGDVSSASIMLEFVVKVIGSVEQL